MVGWGEREAFIDRERGMQKLQSGLTVIMKLVISGLTSITLIVLSTVYL